MRTDSPRNQKLALSGGPLVTLTAARASFRCIGPNPPADTHFAEFHVSWVGARASSRLHWAGHLSRMGGRSADGLLRPTRGALRTEASSAKAAAETRTSTRARRPPQTPTEVYGRFSRTELWDLGALNQG